MLGGTGRTGRLLVAELTQRGHHVTALIRDPEKSPDHARIVVGDSRDPQALAEALDGAEAVISALGPARKQKLLHRETAEQLVPAMRVAGIRRYIGISGAGVNADGDRKSLRDRVISVGMGLFARSMVADKTAELATWQDTELDWTLVRPPRLLDGPPTGSVEHGAHVSTRSTTMRRSDLAAFLVDVLDMEHYVQQAPFAATRVTP